MKKFSIFILVIYALGIIGWGQCVYKFASCDFETSKSWKGEIVYGIGTFTGAGAVIGWFNFGK